MADDHNQRPYRGNDASQRAASGGASANDPLAELARLIGQNDPFSEFGRDGNRRAAAATPRQAEPAPNWQQEPAAAVPPAPKPSLYGSPDFTRQPFGSAPLAGDADVYHADGQPSDFAPAYAPDGQQTHPGYTVPDYEVPGYGAPGYDASGFPVAPAEQAYEDAFAPSGAQRGLGDDYYDDVPPNRRRIGILAIAGVFALAVIGTAGAFGYRAIFGSSSTSPPPVIKAEQAPSKIVPAASNKEAQSKIAERANNPTERLVSREEQPVVVTTTTPPPQNAGPALGSGVVGSEPKKIRTIAIKPDATEAAMPQPPDSVPAPTAQPRAVSTTTQRAAPASAQPPAAAPAPIAAPVQPAAPVPSPAPMRLAAPSPADADPPASVARAAAPAPRAEAPANAPLSLNPNAAPAPAAPAQRAASLAPTPASGVYGVQVTAQRSEEEAQAAFRTLQAKFPGQLGNRQPLIKRVDLGDKGIFFRALVGPFTDSAQASQMCSSLKAAGGSCLVQKN